MEDQPHMVDDDSVALVLGGLPFKIWKRIVWLVKRLGNFTSRNNLTIILQ